ncbi:hypothetical protein DdX_13560 [Ditylenchus destructor]|uniref:Uncharacterized protein n=1 Tax=Ditylenchus destructor TaxID=166010 RepID=A0AAD4MV62_9BILA|nr:hypothetical protein DdX_13560 [Ditylenchus destructor]
MFLFGKFVLFLAFVSLDVAFSDNTPPEYCEDKNKFNAEIKNCMDKDKNTTDLDLNQQCEKKLEAANCMKRVVDPCHEKTRKAFMAYLNMPPNFESNEKCQEARSVLEKMNGGVITDCGDRNKFNDQIAKCKLKEQGATEKDLNQLCEKKLEVAKCMESVVMSCDEKTKKTFFPFLKIPKIAENIANCQQARSILEKMNGGVESPSTVEPPVTVPAVTSVPENLKTTLPADNTTHPGKLNTTDPNGPRTSDGTQEPTGSGCKAKDHAAAFALFAVLAVLKILAIKSSQNL